MKSIAPLVLELRDKELLPAICFNEDRRMCEKLAQQLFDYLEMQQKEFEASAEYKKYEIKDEEVMRVLRTLNLNLSIIETYVRMLKDFAELVYAQKNQSFRPKSTT